MEDANFEEEYNRLIQYITGISDKELAHEAMKVLITQMSLNKRF